MKTVTVQFPHLNDQVAEMYLIDSEEGANEYFSFNQNIARKCFDIALKSRLPINKFDHMIPYGGTVEASIMRMALVRSQHNDVDVDERGYSVFNNPIYQIFPAAKEKEFFIRKAMEEFGQILVNKSGGFMPLDKSKYIILEEKEAEIYHAAPDDELNEGNKWIVLENDYSLPVESRKFLEKMDPNFSIVFDLRGHTTERLIKTFEYFKKNGGEVVFVYTTGLDVEQMYEYVKCMKIADLNTLKFHFNTGRNPDIDKFLEWSKEFLGCDVEVFETLP